MDRCLTVSTGLWFGRYAAATMSTAYVVGVGEKDVSANHTNLVLVLHLGLLLALIVLEWLALLVQQVASEWWLEPLFTDT